MIPFEPMSLPNLLSMEKQIRIDFNQMSIAMRKINSSPDVVLFPTPPFPDATTTISFTPSNGICFGKPRAIISACRCDGFVL